MQENPGLFWALARVNCCITDIDEFSRGVPQFLLSAREIETLSPREEAVVLATNVCRAKGAMTVHQAESTVSEVETRSWRDRRMQRFRENDENIFSLK